MANTIQNKNVYALLTGVGYYEHWNIENLPSYRMDLALMRTGLLAGLRIPEDNIRILCGPDTNGFLSLQDFSRTLQAFTSMLKEDDIFLFYFSGHAGEGNLVFSDGRMQLQSILDHIAHMPVKASVVLLDCCDAGNFSVEEKRRIRADIAFHKQTEKGMSILAGAAPNQKARLGPEGTHSIYTGALCASMMQRSNIRHGRLSLRKISESAEAMIHAWNEEHPEKTQFPVCRSTVIGDVYFPVEVPKKPDDLRSSYGCELTDEKRESAGPISDSYSVVSMKPMDTQNERRLACFIVTPCMESSQILSQITQEIVHNLSINAAWCYFGRDQQDIDTRVFYARTIWAEDSLQGKYYKDNKASFVENKVCIIPNSNYRMLRKMNTPVFDEKQYMQENKKLLSEIVNLSEDFLSDLQEFSNGLIPAAEILQRYVPWIQKVKSLYFRISDLPAPPQGAREWSETALNLTGCVLDMALYLEQIRSDGQPDERTMWLLHHAMEQYQEFLHLLSAMDDDIDI